MNDEEDGTRIWVIIGDSSRLRSHLQALMQSSVLMLDEAQEAGSRQGAIDIILPWLLEHAPLIEDEPAPIHELTRLAGEVADLLLAHGDLS